VACTDLTPLSIGSAAAMPMCRRVLHRRARPIPDLSDRGSRGSAKLFLVKRLRQKVFLLARRSFGSAAAIRLGGWPPAVVLNV